MARSITFWFSEDVIEQWHHANDQPKVGHPFIYSNAAIECLLVLRELFQLPYRQTEGLARSLVQLMEVELAIPDYTSLAKRAARMDIALAVRRHRGPIDVVVGSTGLKVFGEGEWKMRKHGNSAQPPLPRDQAIREIRRRGRRAWKERIGYHRRSLSETAMHRMKCCFGDTLKNHQIANQRTETRLRSKILNHFAHLGLPKFEWS